MAAAAFPIDKGRTGIARSFQVLGTLFAVFVLLILSALGMKVR